MGLTRGGEQGNLLTTGNRVHHIDGRNTRLDHLLGIRTRVRVDGLTIDIQVLLRQYGRRVINGDTRTVEGATQHLLRTIYDPTTPTPT